MTEFGILHLLFGLGGAIIGWLIAWTWRNKRIQRLISVIGERDQSIFRWRGEYEGQVKQYNALTRTSKSVEAERNDLEGFLQDSKSKWKLLDDENRDMETRYGNLSLEYDGYRKRAAGELEKLQAKWNSVQVKYEELSTKYSVALNRIEELNTSLSEKEATNSAKDSELETMSEKNRSLSREFSEAKSKWSDFENKLRTSEANLQSLEQEVEGRNERIRVLESSLEEVKVDRGAWQTKSDNWKSQYSASEKTQSKMQVSLRAMETDGSAKEKDLRAAERELKALRARNANLEAFCGESSIESSKLRTELISLKANYESALARSKTGQDDKVRLNGQRNEWTKQLSDLKNSNRNLSATLEGQKQKQSELEQSVGYWKTKYNSSQDELGGALNRYGALEKKQSESDRIIQAGANERSKSKVEIAKVRNQVENWRSEYSLLERANEKLKIDLKERAIELSSVKKEREQLDRKQGNYSTQIVDLKNRYYSLEKSEQSQSSAAQKSEQIIRTTRQKILSWERKYNDLKQVRDKCMVKIADLQRSEVNLKKEMAASQKNMLLLEKRSVRDQALFQQRLEGQKSRSSVNKQKLSKLNSELRIRPREVKVPVEVIKEIVVIKEVRVPFEVIKKVEVLKEVKVPVEVIKEIEVKVPVEVIKEVVQEVEVLIEVIKEVEVKVPVEVIKEVIKEIQVPVEVIKEVEVKVPVEVIKEVVKEVQVPVEVIKEVVVEVPVEVIKEVVKEVKVPVKIFEEIIKEVKVPVEIVKEVEIIKEVVVIKEVEVIKEVPAKPGFIQNRKPDLKKTKSKSKKYSASKAKETAHSKEEMARLRLFKRAAQKVESSDASQSKKVQGKSEPVKTKSTKGKSGKREDLTKIEGIGPAIQKLLYAKQIFTWKQLSKSKVKALVDILDEAGSRFAMHDPMTWPEQARFAKDGKWDDLKKWQDLHVRGKKK